MTEPTTSQTFRSISITNWRKLMQLVDLVTVLIDHRSSEIDYTVKGQLEIRDHLYNMVEELSVECIQLGMGAEVAVALQRLTQPTPMGFDFGFSNSGGCESRPEIPQSRDGATTH